MALNILLHLHRLLVENVCADRYQSLYSAFSVPPFHIEEHPKQPFTFPDPDYGSSHSIIERFSRRIDPDQKPRDLTTEVPVLDRSSLLQQAGKLVDLEGVFVESVQDEQVARSGLETPLRHGLLEEIGDGGEVGEEGAPAAELGLAGTVDDDFEVL
ncbi:hypothetical protein KC357_g23 [Hortaea werneckii]|nr:hypothetical protein KC357_g23 [Hortaea werneckii]